MRAWSAIHVTCRRAMGQGGCLFINSALKPPRAAGLAADHGFRVPSTKHLVDIITEYLKAKPLQSGLCRLEAGRQPGIVIAPSDAQLFRGMPDALFFVWRDP